MGAGNHGGFGTTKGMRRSGGLIKLDLQFFASKVFEKGGHLSEESFVGHREFFLGKSVLKIRKEMEKYGYVTEVSPSNHVGSKAKFIVVKNENKIRNITMVEVTPGSKQHGDVAYVRISTNDIGKYKIVSDQKKYVPGKGDKAKVYFPRKEQKHESDF
ncbi:hypothetical protein SAMN02910370_01779 [Lachnospiraceae bacterium XPB1003]|nr:hypothetical protein SAMN02910370_01779 [Lachnospiraceae bacterium XPB1003]